MARPTKCTNGTKRAIFEALKAGRTRTAAAAAGNVHYDTLRGWMVADPELREEVEIAEAEAENRMTGVIIDATAETWTAAAWWLERRRHREFARKDQLTLKRLDQMDDDELVAFIAGEPSETTEGDSPSTGDS